MAARQEILALELDRTSACARTARAAVTTVLAGDSRSDSMELIASELVTNAYTHGSGRIQLRLHTTGSSLTISVSCDAEISVLDLMPNLDTLESEKGRGLALVRESSSNFGYEISDSRLTVWAELSAHNLG
jgi:anti-sigma regulatory factor (Ser/Thr protein kinase)